MKMDDDFVYAPSEDSYLLFKAIDYARGDVLDMCTGSGIIGISAAKKADSVILVDINKKCVDYVSKMIISLGIKNAKAIKSDLFSAIGKARFDVIFCNPPYLPGKPKKNDLLDTATCGGKTGCEFTIKFLGLAVKHLKKDGRIFFIMSTLGNPEKIYKASKSLNLDLKTLGTKEFFFEKLILVEAHEKSRHSSGRG